MLNYSFYSFNFTNGWLRFVFHFQSVLTIFMLNYMFLKCLFYIGLKAICITILFFKLSNLWSYIASVSNVDVHVCFLYLLDWSHKGFIHWIHLPKKKKIHIFLKSIFSRLCLLHYFLCLFFCCFSKSLDKTVIMQFLTHFLTEWIYSKTANFLQMTAAVAT